ncbi:MAG: HDOD domain-containing protein [Polyangiaceae bacterium]
MTKPSADRSGELAALWLPGDPDDSGAFEAERSLAAAIAQVEGLRPFAPAVARLMSTLQGNRGGPDAVRMVLESDPTLATRVMAFVNSDTFDVPVRCRSISHAIRLLDDHQLDSFALTMANHERFHETEGPAAEIVAHSARCGTIARLLADQGGSPDKETAFICALLHDIGKLLMLQVSDDLTGETGSDPYLALLERSGGGPDRLHPLEQELYGYGHGVLAAHALRSWSVPPPIPDVIAFHHQPAMAAKTNDKVRTLVAFVRLADQLSYLDVQDETLQASAQVDDSDASLLGLDGSAIDAFWRNNRHLVATSARHD